MFCPIPHARPWAAPGPLGPQSPPLCWDGVSHLPGLFWPHTFFILCPHDPILPLGLIWKENGGETSGDMETRGDTRGSPCKQRHNSGLTFWAEYWVWLCLLPAPLLCSWYSEPLKDRPLF